MDGELSRQASPVSTKQQQCKPCMCSIVPLCTMDREGRCKSATTGGGGAAASGFRRTDRLSAAALSIHGLL